MAWLNKDGLNIKFGTELGASTVDAGDYKTFNRGESVVEFEIDLTTLTEDEQIINDVVLLGSGAQITWVETMAEVGAADGVAIDMGLIHTDRTTTTNVGPQVLLAAAPIAQYTDDGDTVTYYENATVPDAMVGTGSLVGGIVPGDRYVKYYITVSRTTATAFTAGVLKVRIGYIPNALANNA